MATLTVLFRFRLAVLALLSAGTLGAGLLALYGHPVPVGALFLSAASLLVGTALGFAHLRHVGLGLLAALAPIPGLFAAAPFALANGVPVSGLLAAYGFGYLAASMLSADIQRFVREGVEAPDAARKALARGFPALAVSVSTGAALIVGWLFQDARMVGLGAMGVLAGAGLSALVFVPFVAAVLPFGESFFVAANRAGERREAVLRLATAIVEPRWGMSVSGSALVLATIGWFGVAPLLAHGGAMAQPALWAAAALLVFGAAFAIARDWRDALASLLGLALLAVLTLFVWGRATGHFTVTTFVEIAIAAAMALSLTMALNALSRAHRLAGDRPEIAKLRALEAMGLAPWFGAAGAAGAAAPWILLHGSIATLCAMFVLACATAVLAVPALATVLDTLVPRRRSVNELYGRG